jgi:5-(carboxyamino)imidazole ribonucleotide synthase
MKNIGILGKGQLGMLLSQAADRAGHRAEVWDLREQKAFDFSSGQWRALPLAEWLSEKDVITAEIEDLSSLEEALTPCHDRMAPSADALFHLAFRDTEKAVLDRLGIPHAGQAICSSLAEVKTAVEKLNGQAVIKAARSGYDGKGQWRLDGWEHWDKLAESLNLFWHSAPDIRLVVERFVDFDTEVSLVGSRGADGTMVFYPLVENFHDGGILQVTLTDVCGRFRKLQPEAEAMMRRMADDLDYVGTMAIELFVENGELLVNEIAPRVHNSGHWSSDGCRWSQFDNHIRAVTKEPLAQPQASGCSAMINVIGEAGIHPQLLADEGVRCYWYDKAVRPGRKMGHINVPAADAATLRSMLLRHRKHWPAHAGQCLAQAIERLDEALSSVGQ